MVQMWTKQLRKSKRDTENAGEKERNCLVRQKLPWMNQWPCIRLTTFNYHMGSRRQSGPLWMMWCSKQQCSGTGTEHLGGSPVMEATILSLEGDIWRSPPNFLDNFHHSQKVLTSMTCSSLQGFIKTKFEF